MLKKVLNYIKIIILGDDHIKLKNTIKNNITIPWLITYDYTDTIIDIYKDFNTDKLTLTYTAGTNKKGTELMIFSDNLKKPGA